MSFEKRFAQIIQKGETPIEQKLYQNTIVFSGLIFLIIAITIFLTEQNFDVSLINRSLAWTCVVMIGLSLALSGLCYFFNFVDTKIVYRKHLGLVGLSFGLLHGLLTIFLVSRRTNIFAYFASDSHFIPFAAAIAALFIFIFMGSISNRYATHELGSKNWRRTLRLSYLGFIFVIIHFSLLNAPLWKHWWYSGQDYFKPPLSLVFLFFSVLVLLLRIILELAVWKKKL